MPPFTVKPIDELGVKQLIVAGVFAVTSNNGGSTNVTVASSVHPWLLVTVTEYVPGPRLVGLLPDPEGVQAYV